MPPIWTIAALTSIIPPFLRQMPFLPQTSQFIALGWDIKYAGLHIWWLVCNKRIDKDYFEYFLKLLKDQLHYCSSVWVRSGLTYSGQLSMRWRTNGDDISRLVFVEWDAILYIVAIMVAACRLLTFSRWIVEQCKITAEELNLSWYPVLSKFSSYICEYSRFFEHSLNQKLLILTNFVKFIWKCSRGLIFEIQCILCQRITVHVVHYFTRHLL